MIRKLRKVKKKWISLKLMLQACWAHFVVRNNRDFDSSSPVHVSLTSYGRRLHKVFIIIEMLMKQTAPMNSLTLYISNQDMRREQLPSSLKRLEKRGLTLCFVDENICSYKKIYYSYLKHHKNEQALLVTADDDVLYSSNWLEELVHASSQHPNAVVAHRCKTITLDVEGKPKAYRQWNGQHDIPCDHIKHHLIMPTGVGGVLYPVTSLMGLEQQKNDFMQHSRCADDIWLKCLTYYNGFESKLTRPRSLVTYPSVITLSTKRKGLALYNVYQGGNDKQMAQTMEYFGINFLSNH